MYSLGFEWPLALILLLILPLFYYFEKYFNRKNRIKGAKFSRLVLLEKAAGETMDYKKKYFSILFTLAVITGVFAIARPQVLIEVPVNPVKLMIVFDTSISMEADDMKPNRLTVARDTAIDFVKKFLKAYGLVLNIFMEALMWFWLLI